MNDETMSKFFKHIINCDDYDEIRSWLRKQADHEIRLFHDSFNFQNSMDRQSLLAQELERRDNLRSSKDKWIDRLLAFVSGGLFVFILEKFLF